MTRNAEVRQVRLRAASHFGWLPAGFDTRARPLA